MMELRWEKQPAAGGGEAAIANATIHYVYSDGREIQGGYARESIMLIAAPNGKWGLRYNTPGGSAPQYIMREAVDIETAKTAAIAAIPEFVQALRIAQDNTPKYQRKAISWGPASGGVIATI